MSNLNEQDLAEMQENRNIIKLKRMLKETDVDEVMLWVQSPNYQDEVFDVRDKDITDNNGRLVKHITFKFTGMGEPNVTGDLMEWKNLVEELSRKEVLLYRKKEAYQVMSDKIIGETDFKALFGKNNADVRKQYVKEQLRTEHETIKALEFSIDWIGRRISFLRELVKTKRVLLEGKQWCR